MALLMSLQGYTTWPGAITEHCPLNCVTTMLVLVVGEALGIVGSKYCLHVAGTPGDVSLDCH
jgi:hypothetical protein